MRVISEIVLHVCTDCVMAIAGYDSRETEADVDRASAAQATIWPGYTLVNGKSHRDCGHGPDDNEICEESWFSWQSCDGCEELLGGDRYYATALLFG